MSQTLVFYAGTVVAELPPVNSFWKLEWQDLLDGSYIYLANGTWAIKMYGWQPMATEDVPKDIRLMAKLLSR